MSPHVTFWRPLEGSHSSGCRVYNALQWSFLLCAASQNRQAIPNLPNNPEAFGNLWDQPAPIGMQCTDRPAHAKARKGGLRVSTASQMPQRCRTLPGDFARLLMTRPTTSSSVQAARLVFLSIQKVTYQQHSGNLSWPWSLTHYASHLRRYRQVRGMRMTEYYPSYKTFTQIL